MRGEETTIGTLDDELLDWRFKGFPAEAVTAGAVSASGWSVLGGDLLLPILVLKESALAHNLASMAAFCRRHRVDLAPHGKTTMAPQLFARQLEAGAWAITTATVSQARVARAFGIPRVLVANEVVEPAAVRWIADELDADPGFDCFCLVDSVAGVARMEAALAGGGRSRPLPVLLEVGARGGRAGCREVGEALALAAAVAGSASLALAGVEAFEGILQTAAEVDAFLERVAETACALSAAGRFDGADEVLVTAGGSVWFDRVVETLGALELAAPVRLVLRSGCYLTHDSGSYDAVSPLGRRAAGDDALRAALEAWGVVLSRPEPGLAIAGFGKRDVPYDAGLPVPLHVARDGAISRAPAGLEVVSLNDQHAYLRVPPAVDLAVGDLVGCGISHPCTAFDKWTLLALVDDDYRVTGTVRTFF